MLFIIYITMVGIIGKLHMLHIIAVFNISLRVCSLNVLFGKGPKSFFVGFLLFFVVCIVTRS